MFYRKTTAMFTPWAAPFWTPKVVRRGEWAWRSDWLLTKKLQCMYFRFDSGIFLIELTGNISNFLRFVRVARQQWMWQVLFVGIISFSAEHFQLHSHPILKIKCNGNLFFFFKLNLVSKRVKLSQEIDDLKNLSWMSKWEWIIFVCKSMGN